MPDRLDIFEWADMHGCLTGDCPHDNVHDCVESITEHMKDVSAHGKKLAILLRQCVEDQANGFDVLASASWDRLKEWVSSDLE